MQQSYREDRAPYKEDRSFAQLLSDLMHEWTTLVRQEMRLVKAEASESASRAGAGVAEIAIGGLLAFAALLVLLQALVIALSNFVPPAVASLIVGIVVAVIGFVLVQKGRSNLKMQNLAPDRTVASLRADQSMVAEHTERLQKEQTQ